MKYFPFPFWKRKENPFLLPIVLSAALTVALSLGLSMGIYKAEESFLASYGDHQGEDLRISSLIPFSEDEIEGIQNLDFAEIVEAFHQVKVEITGHNLSTTLLSLPKEVNLLSYQEGIEHITDALVSPEFLAETALEIGDSFTILQENILSEDTFTIVGVAESPYYYSGSAGIFQETSAFSGVYLKHEVFLQEYSNISIKINPESLNTLSKAYIQGELEKIAQEMLLNSTAVSQALIREKEAEQALSLAFAMGEEKMSQLQEELTALEVKVTSAWHLTPEEENISQYEEKITELIVDMAQAERENYEIIEEKLFAYESAQREGKRILFSTFTITWQEEAPSKLAFFEETSYLKRLNPVITLLFYALFLCHNLFIMVKTISKERKEIGIYLSLGYHFKKIYKKYSLLSGISALLGGALGCLLAYHFLPSLLYREMEEHYLMGEFSLPPEPFFFHLLLVTFLAGVVGLVPCFFVVKQYPLTLLSKKAPLLGKKIFLEKNHILWSELNFNQKIAMRSLFRHKLRFLLQVSAISLGTALLVVALACGDSFIQLANRQYEKIYLYSMEITMVDDYIPTELLQVKSHLASYHLENHYTIVETATLPLSTGTGKAQGEMIVFPTDSQGNERINFCLGPWQAYFMPKAGVILPQKIKEILAVNLGDSIAVTEDKSMIVSSIQEQYTEMRLYTTASYWETLGIDALLTPLVMVEFSSEIEENPDLLREFVEVTENLSGVDKVTLLEEESQNLLEKDHLLKKVLQIAVILFSLLTFFIMLQLCRNNFESRREELALLKVNGLHDKELLAYVYRENLFYTFFALSFGMVLGQNLYLWLMNSLEPEHMMFYRLISVNHFFTAAVLTVIFAIITNLLTYFQIKKLSMVNDLSRDGL